MNRKMSRVFVSSFVLVVITLVLTGGMGAAGTARAATTETITLISGNGSIGSLDAANQFTVDGGAT